MFSTRSEFITPDELGTVQASARGELPLGFRRQLFADPLGVSFNVFVSDVHHRVLRFALQRARRTFRMAPVCSGNVYPPVVAVSQIDPLAWFIEDNRSGHE